MDNEDAIIEYENILNVQSHIKQIPNVDFITKFCI